jgi:hypothetical protein
MFLLHVVHVLLSVLHVTEVCFKMFTSYVKHVFNVMVFALNKSYKYRMSGLEVYKNICLCFST